MLYYLTESELREKPKLADSMFKDRANQFVSRHGWPDLSVDNNGWETDKYDRLDPLYVVIESAQGAHVGSVRLMPMSGPNMLHDYFNDLIPKDTYRERGVWECTRFLKSPSAPSVTSLELFIGVHKLLEEAHIDCVLGLFNTPMLRIYRVLGWEPEVIAKRCDPTARLFVGRWKKGNAAWHIAKGEPFSANYLSSRMNNSVEDAGRFH